MVIKPLIIKDFSYAYYLSALHNIQDLYAIYPSIKVLPSCLCCLYAGLPACSTNRIFRVNVCLLLFELPGQQWYFW